MNTMKSMMMFLMLMAVNYSIHAQGKYFTRNGNVTFNSGTTLEKIEGINHKAATVLDAATGQVEFTVLIKAFEFERALMQDHFNENYMESDKFPKASFKGTIQNNNDIPYATGGTFKTQVKGDITVHGVTKPLTVNATGEVKDNKLVVKSNFEITLEDYKIDIPSLVKDKVDKQAKIEVDLVLDPLAK